MDSSDGVRTVVACILLTLLPVPGVRGRRRMPPKHRAAESDSSGERAGESTRAEREEGRTVQDERHRLIEAKASAEKAYAQRVSAAEREFNAEKNRADVHLRAAEIFLEHAQGYGQGRLGAMRGREGTLEAWEHEIAYDDQAFTDASVQAGVDTTGDFFIHSGSTLTAPAINQAARPSEGLDRRRGQRIHSAQERLVDAMFEHRLAVAAAEKKLGNVKAQRDDLLSALAALEAFDAQPGRSPAP